MIATLAILNIVRSGLFIIIIVVKPPRSADEQSHQTLQAPTKTTVVLNRPRGQGTATYQSHQPGSQGTQRSSYPSTQKASGKHQHLSPNRLQTS